MTTLTVKCDICHKFILNDAVIISEKEEKKKDKKKRRKRTCKKKTEKILPVPSAR